MTRIAYDSRAVTFDGKRALLLCGSIHYPRSTPAMWPTLMARSREAGLNAIDTYVFWNLHERQRGVFDFSGRLDLLHFCRLAQEHGLSVVMRVGPYICAETNYGGFPAWLRDVPDMRMRTWNQPFMREMERWLRFLCDYLKPMFAPNGGPIVLAQLENEFSNIAKNYGAEGQRYLAWVAELGQKLNPGVPWVMCMGGAPGVLETLNQSDPHLLLDEHFKKHPDQPAFCTELYPGWYGGWTLARATRRPERLAYSVARFIAAGGTGVTYYMWHGGTNFGRESMYLQTTSYDFEAPLDEYGLTTTKSEHLKRLHHLLHELAPDLLGRARPKPQPLGEKQMAYTYGDSDDADAITFLCNDDDEQTAPVVFRDHRHDLAPRSVQVFRRGKTIFDTSVLAKAARRSRTWTQLRRALSPFTTWAEPMPEEWPADAGAPVVAAKPQEQLALTRDLTDYCWYSTRLTVTEPQTKGASLTLERVADVVHVFVDGELKATTPTPLRESRDGVDSESFKQEFSLTLPAGNHELSLLCGALGLIKGDWMIGGQNMVNERKGLWGAVRWGARELPGPWRHRPGLLGERCRVFAEGQPLVKWKKLKPQRCNTPLRWYRASFDLPDGNAPLALDLTAMNKGLAWVNGRCLGRYWQAPAAGDLGPWLVAWIDEHSLGRPPQRHYHVPRDWLTKSENTLVIFEEIGGDPAGIRLCQRV